MKTLHISVTLLFTFLVFFNAQADREAALEACSKKLNLTPEKLHELEENETNSKENNDLYCFLACVHKELGQMNEDGNYNREALLKELPPSDSQEYQIEIVDTCLEQKGTDECETTRLFHACIKKLNPVPYTSEELKKMHDDCKDELGMTNEEVTENMRLQGELETDCFGACLMKSVGFLNKDGTFNEEVYIRRAPSTKTAKRLAEICAEEVGADDCETTARIFKCFKKYDVIPDEVPSPPPRE